MLPAGCPRSVAGLLEDCWGSSEGARAEVGAVVQTLMGDKMNEAWRWAGDTLYAFVERDCSVNVGVLEDFFNCVHMQDILLDPDALRAACVFDYFPGGVTDGGFVTMEREILALATLNKGWKTGVLTPETLGAV